MRDHRWRLRRHFTRFLARSARPARGHPPARLHGGLSRPDGLRQAFQLRPWLYAIARNRCFTLLKSRREHPLDRADEPSTENLSSAVERRQDLRDLLSDVSALPDEQRAALVLAELGACSHEEIATVLAVPRDKVKALVFQGRSSRSRSR